MSMDNALESATLDFILKGTDPSWRAGATLYAALVTDVGGAVDEATPLANECTYTGYSRVALTKSSAWSGSGASRTNASQIQWGKRTDAGATQTATAVLICDTASGAINMSVIAEMADDLAISQNITPIVGAGDLTITAA